MIFLSMLKLGAFTCKGNFIRFKVFFGTMFFRHKKTAPLTFRIETEIQMCRCKTENYNGNSIFFVAVDWTTGKGVCVYIYICISIYSNISYYIYITT